MTDNKINPLGKAENHKDIIYIYDCEGKKLCEMYTRDEAIVSLILSAPLLQAENERLKEALEKVKYDWTSDSSRWWEIIQKIPHEQFINVLKRETGQGQEMCEAAFKSSPWNFQGQLEYIKKHGAKF